MIAYREFLLIYELYQWCVILYSTNFILTEKRKLFNVHPLKIFLCWQENITVEVGLWLG